MAKILIIDDSATIRSKVREALLTTGHEILKVNFKDNMWLGVRFLGPDGKLLGCRRQIGVLEVWQLAKSNNSGRRKAENENDREHE